MARQIISTYMGAGFGWVIGVVDSGCILIHNVLLEGVSIIDA